LAAAAGLWLWKGDEWAPATAPRSAPPDAPALASLESDLTPGSLTRIEIHPPGGDPFVFEKAQTGWTQPGNWPLRTAEVKELVETLGTLRTRFQPVPIPEGTDLAAFGLADSQKPLLVKVRAGTNNYDLRFGEGQTENSENLFTRPAYVRVGDAGEVLKLGPDVIAVLRRPADSYRRRQLFAEVERVKLAGGPAQPQPGLPPEPAAPTVVTLPGPAVTEIRVSAASPKVFGLAPWASSGSFALKRIGPTPEPSVTDKNATESVQPDRLAGAWAVESPVKDRPDPAALRRVLAAVPDLWVEEFIPAGQAGRPQPSAVAEAFPAPLEPLAALARFRAALVDPREGLKGAKQSISVTTTGGGTVTVKFGGVAKVTEREESVTLPGAPGMPPRTVQQKVKVTYRYAQVEGNPQLFTVPADKVEPLFAKAGELVDPRVARFNPDDVRAVTVQRPGKPPIALTRKKGDPKAANPDDRQDRWLIEQKPNPLLADSARVEELVNRLADFRGEPDADLYRADPKSRGLDPASCVTVTRTAREKRPEGEPEAPSREYKIRIGAPDLAGGKLPVQLAGWPRITLVSDRSTEAAAAAGWLAPALFPSRLEPLFRRDAVAYRSGKLFDTADAKLTAIAVSGDSSFALRQEKKAGGGEEWKLTAPVASGADPQGAGALASELAALRAKEFVAEGAANPAEYGLAKPKYTVSLTFDNGRTYRLEVGGPRPGTPDLFARLDGGAVLAVPATITTRLTSGALALLPLKVWSVPVDQITAAEITRPGKPDQSFALAKDGTNWKLTGPFTAPVPFLNAQPMLTELGNLTAVKYESLTAADPAKFGLDKPAGKVKLTYSERAGGGERTASKTLLIGGGVPGGGSGALYARLDEPNAPVFVLPPAYTFPAQTPPLSLLDRGLLNLDPARVAKVQIAGDKPEDAITLVKDRKGEWKAEGAAFKVDPVVARQVAETFAPLPVERIAAYGDAVKWADFGLEKPANTVTVTLAGDKPETHAVQLGKEHPAGGYFVRVDGGKAVGHVPAVAKESLARAKLDFADRTLLSFKPEELLGLVRARGKEELELAPGAGDGWDVVKPMKLKADRPLVEELADALSRLRAERIVAFGKKAAVYKQFGLEPPEATLTLTVGEKAEQKVLRFGKPVDAAKPDGDRFAAVESPGAEAAVAVLPAALAKRLLAPPVSFRDRTMAKFVDADQLVLARGGRTVTFRKVNGTWKVTKPVMADAEQAALDDLVNEFAKLRAADWVSAQPTPAELKAFGLESPEATWTVSNGDKVELKLRLGKKTPDGRAYATTGTGGMVALLGPLQTSKALGEYRVRKPWALDGFQAEAVEITRGGKAFLLKKNGTAWSDPDAPGDAIDPRVVTELLGTLTALQVERFAVDADADLKLFGLDRPDTTIAVTLKDGTKTLAIGGPVGGTDGKQRYARVVEKGRTDVFVLSAADTARLTRDRAAFVPKK
jgi:hypothetical protein